MNIMVCMFVRDRYNHVKLCSEFLHRSKGGPGFSFTFVAIDDQSQDPRIAGLLREYNLKVLSTTEDYDNQDARLGAARSRAVGAFLNCSHCDYLLLLDSDVIVAKTTIVEAVQDYEMLCEKKYPIGGATLYALAHREKEIIEENKTFYSVSLTGDAHMLFRRDHLQEVGNHFSSALKGFADKQIQAIRRCGKIYWTRTNPPYLVQHIGFGLTGSMIYEKAARRPWWTMRPYWSFPAKQMINIPGFDVLHYTNLVNTHGGAEAPAIYLSKKGVPS